MSSYLIISYRSNNSGIYIVFHAVRLSFSKTHVLYLYTIQLGFERRLIIYACLSVRLSFRPSVSPSVCPSESFQFVSTRSLKICDALLYIKWESSPTFKFKFWKELWCFGTITLFWHFSKKCQISVNFTYII